MDSQLKSVESEMQAIMLTLDSLIMTIPGIGFVNGGMILGELGDIKRFFSASKVLAFYA